MIHAFQDADLDAIKRYGGFTRIAASNEYSGIGEIQLYQLSNDCERDHRLSRRYYANILEAQNQ
jgi:hypothetical protein